MFEKTEFDHTENEENNWSSDLKRLQRSECSSEFENIIRQKRKGFNPLTEVKHIKGDLQDNFEANEPAIQGYYDDDEDDYYDDDGTSRYLVFSQDNVDSTCIIPSLDQAVSENVSNEEKYHIKDSQAIGAVSEDASPCIHAQGLCQGAPDFLQRPSHLSSSSPLLSKKEFDLKMKVFPKQSGRFVDTTLIHNSDRAVTKCLQPEDNLKLCTQALQLRTKQVLEDISGGSSSGSTTAESSIRNEMGRTRPVLGVSLFEPPNQIFSESEKHSTGITELLGTSMLAQSSNVSLHPSTYTEMFYYKNDLPIECLERNKLYTTKSPPSSYDTFSDAESSFSCESTPSPPRTSHQKLIFPVTKKSEPSKFRFSAAFSPQNNYCTGAPKYCLEKLFTPLLKEKIIDTHCHLDFLFQKENHRGTFSAYKNKNETEFLSSFGGCVTNFIEPAFFTKQSNWENILKEDNIWASFGVHPHFSNRYDGIIEEILKDALTHNKVVAVGEIGLDYSSKNNCDKDLQQQIFKRQLQIAVERKMPVIIHCRDAQEDCLRILSENVPRDTRIHRHCFTGNWLEAQEWLEKFPNLYLGFTSLVTFRSVRPLHEVVKFTPVQRLLFETDAPYFVPSQVLDSMPPKGYKARKFSHPGMVTHVAAQIAAIKGIEDFPLFLAAVRDNTRKMYNI